MKYTFSSEITISVTTDVEANSLSNALREAAVRGLMSLCHQCSAGEPELEWVTSGELDGEIGKITSVTVDDNQISEKHLKQVNREWRSIT